MRWLRICRFNMKRTMHCTLRSKAPAEIVMQQLGFPHQEATMWVTYGLPLSKHTPSWNITEHRTYRQRRRPGDGQIRNACSSDQPQAPTSGVRPRSSAFSPNGRASACPDTILVLRRGSCGVLALPNLGVAGLKVKATSEGRQTVGGFRSHRMLAGKPNVETCFKAHAN